MNLIALSARAGVRLAEVAVLLLLFAGVWLVAAQIPRLKLSRTRTGLPWPNDGPFHWPTGDTAAEATGKGAARFVRLAHVGP